MRRRRPRSLAATLSLEGYRALRAVERVFGPVTVVAVLPRSRVRPGPRPAGRARPLAPAPVRCRVCGGVVDRATPNDHDACEGPS
jgi:hypothetical protein